MTKREAQEYNWMMDRLRAMGFTQDEAEALRRISMTLRRWSELECGDSNDWASWAIERDEQTEKPYMVRHSHRAPFAVSRHAIADRERGALKRLEHIIGARNARVKPAAGETRIDPISYYVQGDPRGCALYILRPEDVPEGADVNSYYTRGLAVA